MGQERAAKPCELDCSSFSLEEFAGAVICGNEQLQKELKEELEGFLNLRVPGWENNCALLVCGSDGRLEKGFGSRLALVAVVKDAPRAIFEVVKEVTRSFSLEEVEIKRLGGTVPLSYYQGNPERVWPDKILDARFLIGNLRWAWEAKQTIVEEMKERRIIGRLRGARKGFAKATRTGTYRRGKIFSLERGEAYYWGDRGNGSFCFGVKMGPLRLVQVAVNRFLGRRFQQQRELLPWFLELPTNTAEKIEFLAQKGWLNFQEAQVSLAEIQQAYWWFLRLYHRQQYNYLRNGQSITPFERGEFEKWRRIILAFDQFLSSCLRREA